MRPFERAFSARTDIVAGFWPAESLSVPAEMYVFTACAHLDGHRTPRHDDRNWRVLFLCITINKFIIIK